MSRSMVGFQVIFTLVFFIGISVHASPMDRCLEMINFEKEFDNLITQASTERLQVFCTNMTAFIKCLDDVTQEETGFTLRDLAYFFEDHYIGKALKILLNLEDVVVETCTPGTALHEDYMEHAECYGDINYQTKEECEEQAKAAYDAYESLRSLEGETERHEMDESCVVTAYQFGCLGAAVHEACGDKAFKTYKDIVRKIGFLKSGLCSSKVVEAIKTNIVEGLEISESRKGLYSVIFDLKKRRK